MACREHEDYGEDVDHEIEVGDAFLVLTNVDKYLTWVVVEVVYSIPMAEHKEDWHVAQSLAVEEEYRAVECWADACC